MTNLSVAWCFFVRLTLLSFHSHRKAWKRRNLLLTAFYLCIEVNFCFCELHRVPSWLSVRRIYWEILRTTWKIETNWEGSSNQLVATCCEIIQLCLQRKCFRPSITLHKQITTEYNFFTPRFYLSFYITRIGIIHTSLAVSVYLWYFIIS